MFNYPFATTALLGLIFRTSFKEVQNFPTLSRGDAAVYESLPSPFYKWELGQAHEGTCVCHSDTECADPTNAAVTCNGF
jgi:hypothetical protein